MSQASDFALPSRDLTQPRCPAGGAARPAGSTPAGCDPPSPAPSPRAAGMPSPHHAAFLGRPRTTVQTPWEKCQAALSLLGICIRCPGARLGRDKPGLATASPGAGSRFLTRFAVALSHTN